MRRRSFLRAAAGAGLAAKLPARSNGFRWPHGARAAVSLTYDDGVDVDLDHAVPDLEAVKLRGTFYVPGNSRCLYRRLDEWRAIARRGHELGNHTMFHPCRRVAANGERRDWLRPERELEHYTVRQYVEEVRAASTTLLAVDGRRQRTFAYSCCDLTAGGNSFVDELRPLFVAARAGGERRIVSDVRRQDPFLVPSWMVRDVSGRRMIDFVREAVAAGTMAVLMFHGVGGGHSINISRRAHRQLLAWLDQHRDAVWTDTFFHVMRYVTGERNRRG